MADLFSLLISALSFVVSGLATWIAWKAHRENVGLQQRMLEIEEQRERDRRLSASQARLYPKLREVSSSSCRLYLVNSGMAAARNVRVMLDDKPLADHPAAVQDDPMPTEVGPNSEVSCLLGCDFKCGPPFQIEVHWEDDSGSDRTYRGILTD